MTSIGKEIASKTIPGLMNTASTLGGTLTKTYGGMI
jgi:hypothetical protein